MQRTDGKSTLCANAVTHLVLLLWYYVIIQRLGFHFQHAWAHTSCTGGSEICSNKEVCIYQRQNMLLFCCCWGVGLFFNVVEKILPMEKLLLK